MDFINEITMNIREKIIKLLGGYTQKEYNRIENKYQALLDSKTKDNTATIVNEYIWRTLSILHSYARQKLYNKPLDEWTSNMFNVIKNNMYRIVIRYINTNSHAIYNLDTTLELPNQFKQILIDGHENDELEFILEND